MELELWAVASRLAVKNVDPKISGVFDTKQKAEAYAKDMEQKGHYTEIIYFVPENERCVYLCAEHAVDKVDHPLGCVVCSKPASHVSTRKELFRRYPENSIENVI